MDKPTISEDIRNSTLNDIIRRKMNDQQSLAFDMDMAKKTMELPTTQAQMDAYRAAQMGDWQSKAAAGKLAMGTLDSNIASTIDKNQQSITDNKLKNINNGVETVVNMLNSGMPLAVSLEQLPPAMRTAVSQVVAAYGGDQIAAAKGLKGYLNSVVVNQPEFQRNKALEDQKQTNRMIEARFREGRADARTNLQITRQEQLEKSRAKSQELAAIRLHKSNVDSRLRAVEADITRVTKSASEHPGRISQNPELKKQYNDLANELAGYLKTKRELTLELENLTRMEKGENVTAAPTQAPVDEEGVVDLTNYKKGSKAPAPQKTPDKVSAAPTSQSVAHEKDTNVLAGLAGLVTYPFADLVKSSEYAYRPDLKEEWEQMAHGNIARNLGGNPVVDLQQHLTGRYTPEEIAAMRAYQG